MSGLPMPILESYRVPIPSHKVPWCTTSYRNCFGGGGQARMKFLSSGPSDGAKRRIRTKGRRLSVTFE
jgi:hypothetical protein